MAAAKGNSSEKKENVRYFFPVEEIPRLSCKDMETNRIISADRPVVITDSELVSPAMKWDLAYLSANMGNGDCNVYESDSNVFKYFDEAKRCDFPDFEPSMKRLEMKFSEFVENFKVKAGAKKYYLQQTLNDSVGKRIVMDFLGFNWTWINEQQQRNNWGNLTSNLLLLGKPGSVTPPHYDEQQNFFAQIRGKKRVVMFPPSDMDKLYPYPIYHPHDRQSQVDLENPDFEKFPKAKELRGYEAEVGPGDVLYIPMYWWHNIESLDTSDYAISVNFWYKSGPTGKVQYPLKPHQKVAMMRNIEKIITETLNNHLEVAPFMQAMVLGRYT